MNILSLPVTWAMAILTVLGLASVLSVAVGELSDDFEEHARLQTDLLLTNLAARVGGLTHELQKERGVTAGFLASRGTAFADALPRQRLESDKAIKAYNAGVAEFREGGGAADDLDRMLRDVDQQLAALDVLRSDVDRQTISPSSAVSQITLLNRSAISLLPEKGKSIANSNASRAVQRQAILMTAKDVMGLERASGATGFAQADENAGLFPDATLGRFQTLINEQTTLLSVYQAISTEPLARALDELAGSATSLSVGAMRDAALSDDPARVSEISSETWFDAITAKIDLLKGVEDMGTAEIDQFIRLALLSASQEIRTSLLLLAAKFAVLIGLSSGLIFFTSRALNRTANRVAGLAGGDIDSAIVQAPQRDLAKITQALAQFQAAERERRETEDLQKALESSSADGIKRISASVASGDFKDRLRLRDLQGATLILGKGINEILKTAEDFVNKQRTSDQELLAKKQAENEAQEQAIASLETVVTAYSSGDFSKRMSADGLEGVWARVADGINQIAAMTDRALDDVRTVMMAVADGSLDRRMSAGHQGTFAEISEATNASLDTLEIAFRDISDGVSHVGIATSELRTGVSELTTRSDAQATTVAESSSATRQLAKSIEDNSLNLGRCNELMRALQTKTSEGQVVAKGAIETMSEIEAASTEMEKIVATIEEIAFQTNLLALNASVEAARAGEAGKGFAVVAAEVRGLANRCADASRQIGDLISESVRGVTEGAADVRKTGEAVGEVEQTLKAVHTVIDDVLLAGDHQSQGVSILSQAVLRLDRMAQSNVELARGNMELIEQLSDQETKLSGAVSRFLKDGKGVARSIRLGAA